MERTRTIQRNRQTVPDRCEIVDLLRAISDPEGLYYAKTRERIETNKFRYYYRHNRAETNPIRAQDHRHRIE